MSDTRTVDPINMDVLHSLSTARYLTWQGVARDTGLHERDVRAALVALMADLAVGIDADQLTIRKWGTRYYLTGRGRAVLAARRAVGQFPGVAS